MSSPEARASFEDEVNKLHEERFHRDIENLKDSSRYEGMYETADIDALMQAIHILHRLGLHNHGENPVKDEKLRHAERHLQDALEELKESVKDQSKKDTK